MTYERRASPLHACRAAVAGVWCVVLVCALLAFEHPLVLGALALATVLGACGARVGRRVLRVLRFALPFGLLIVLVNVLVVREGLTVVFRLGEVPPFGQVDLTLEALVYGAVLAVRATAMLLAAALLSATVDPDEVLRGFRRVSFRSALTAALAVRLVPVLQRDGARMGEARRLRVDAPPRVAVLRAVVAGSLDRAADVAATLELRGYRSSAAPARDRRAARAPWSRHDVAFALSALALVALTVVAHVLDAGSFAAYPTLAVPVGAQEWALVLAFVVAALAPFADRRGIEP